MGGSRYAAEQTQSTNVSAVALPGIYGTLGSPASGNMPGARKNAATWTDSSGNFWLFGGSEDIYGNNQLRIFNDLWRFNPSTHQWTWMGGSNSSDCKACGRPGVYGALATASSENLPGSRAFANSWTDRDGNFWLYGGGGYDSAKNIGTLSDLWMFNPSTLEWTWVGGESRIVGFGTCETLGTPDSTSTPGMREFSASWIDNNGDLWLFGGWGMVVSVATGKSSNSGDQNDLWKFDLSTGEWACMRANGETQTEYGERGIPGIYDSQGDPDDRNAPGGRDHAAGWTDRSGNLWLFGGTGRDSINQLGNLNDLWEFDQSSSAWAWIGGGESLHCNESHQCGLSGVYGKLGKHDAKNWPGGRTSAASWTDAEGGFWLFGGNGFDAKGNSGPLNDLWRFTSSTREWIWMNGSTITGPGFIRSLGISVNNPRGSYGTLGLPSPTNAPGGRDGASSWTDRDGNLWLFGGQGYDAVGHSGYLNDLWEYRFLPATPRAEAPTFSQVGGTYSKTQYLRIADPTPDSAIFYTLDGTAPTTMSIKYATGITIAKTTTVRAIAIASGYEKSEVATATYTIVTVPTH